MIKTHYPLQFFKQHYGSKLCLKFYINLNSAFTTKTTHTIEEMSEPKGTDQTWSADSEVRSSKNGMIWDCFHPSTPDPTPDLSPAGDAKKNDDKDKA